MAKNKIPSICAFCIKKGIEGPHDHMVRDFGKKGSPICCPELLKNVCDNCNELGHTRSHCPVLKKTSTKFGKRPCMRVVDGKSVIWRHPSLSLPQAKHRKINDVNNFSANFGALNVDMDIDDTDNIDDTKNTGDTGNN